MWWAGSSKTFHGWNREIWFICITARRAKDIYKSNTNFQYLTQIVTGNQNFPLILLMESHISVMSIKAFPELVKTTPVCCQHLYCHH